MTAPTPETPVSTPRASGAASHLPARSPDLPTRPPDVPRGARRLLPTASRHRQGVLPNAHPVVVDVLAATVLAAVLLPVTVSSMLALQLSRGWAVAVLVAFGILHLTPATRRSVPVVGYVVACAAMLVVVIAPNGQLGSAHSVMAGFPMLFMPSSLVFLPVLNGVAVAASRRLSLLALLGALGGVGLSLVRIGMTVPDEYPSVQYRIYVALALSIAVLAAWGLGTAHVVHARLEAVERAEAARDATLAERARIAQDMHDIVAHSLAVIVRQAEGGAAVAPRSPDRAVEVLNTVSACARDALHDLRGMLGVLRSPDGRAGPGTDARRDPPSAPQPSLAELDALCERVSGSGIRVTRSTSGTPVDLGPAAELAAYHVVREALTNTVKHAGRGATAEVDLGWHADRLVLRVCDDGGDPDGVDGERPRTPVPGAGAGLPGLRERVTAVGGTLVAERRDPGFVVRAELPRRAGDRGNR
ncbi:MAG: hypothetical protein GXX79_00885 [Actinomycetales bacterium]|nr:hypothetical protein [Actinomycetales bacterium]